MRRRMIIGFPFGPRLELLLVAGAAYFAWQHEQGKHTQPQLLCPICLLNKIAPASEAPSGATPSGDGGTPSGETPAPPEQ
jgi:hypothetical protein